VKLALTLATILALAACHRDVDLRPPGDGGVDAMFVTDAQSAADAEPPDAGP
jgi:hypothetical protein